MVSSTAATRIGPGGATPTARSRDLGPRGEVSVRPGPAPAPAPAPRWVLRAGLLVLCAAVLLGGWRAGHVPRELATIIAALAIPSIAVGTRRRTPAEAGLPVVPIDLAVRLAGESHRR